MQHTAPRPAQQPTLGPEWIEAFVGSIATAVAAQLRQQSPAKPAPATSGTGSPFMTINEAAVFLRCKPQRLYDLLSARTLQGYKDGGRTLIKRSELEMYVTAAEQSRTGAQRASGRS